MEKKLFELKKQLEKGAKPKIKEIPREELKKPINHSTIFLPFFPEDDSTI